MKRLVPSPSMAVALLALFVALTGSAYAGVKLNKNSVTTKTIKNSAVTNAKIKNSAVTAKKVKKDTLTGKQINESTLAGIDAATLGGQAPSSFLPSSSVVKFNVAMNRGDAPRTLATFGPFTLTGSCSPNGATNFDGLMTVTSSNSQSFYWTNPIAANTPVNVVSLNNMAPNAPTYTSEDPMFHDAASGLTTFDGDGEQLGILMGYPDANCRFVGSFFID